MTLEVMLIDLMREIKKNQDEILRRMKGLEDQVNGEWLSVREIAQMKGCSIQAIHKQLGTNPEIEPEVDWVLRGGKYMIKRVAANKITVRKSS